MRNTRSVFTKYYSFLRSYLFSRCTYLIFFVTSECNGRCKTCFYWEDIEKAKGKKILTLEEIELIAKNFKHLAYLSITGGEPILRDGLDEIIYYFYKNSGVRIVNFTTNGLLPERTEETVRAILSKCPDLNLKVNLSLDHVGDKNDEIRGVRGAFEKALETFSYLKRLKDDHRNLYLAITTVLSSYNKDTVFEMIDYVRNDIAPDAHSIALIRGNPRESEAGDVTASEYKRVIDYLSDTPGSKKGFMQKALELMMRVNFETFDRKKMILPCVAGRKILTLTEEGLVIPCEMIGGIFPGRDFVMGDLRENDYDINKVLDLRKARETIDFIRRSRCRCTFECATLWNIVFNLRMYPRILMSMTR